MRRARSVTQEKSIRFMLKREQVQETHADAPAARGAGRRATVERQFGCSDLGKHLAVADAARCVSCRSPLPPGRPLAFRWGLTRRRRARALVNSSRFNQKESLRLASERSRRRLPDTWRRCMTRRWRLEAHSPVKGRARGGGR